MSISVFPVTCAEDVHELEAAWTSIQEAGGVLHPMYTWQWMSTWWEVFGRGRSLCALVAEQGEQPVAVAPFVKHGVKMNRVFSLQRLELLGTGEPGYEEVFTEYADFPARPGLESRAVEAIAEELLEFAGEPGWDDVVFHRVRPNSVVHALFRELAARGDLASSCLYSGMCPYIILPESLPDYMQQLGKKRRYQTRRSLRDLNELGDVQVRKARTVDEALSTFDALKELHQARWRARGEPGAFGSRRFADFHRKFIRRTFDLGWPELWTVSLDGEPIACRYNIRYNGSVSCYMSGMQLTEKKRVQPGIVAHYFAIKDAIETGAREYDFLLGEQSYKKSLSNAERELRTMRISRKTLKERFRRIAVPAGRRVRGVFRWAKEKWPS